MKKLLVLLYIPFLIGIVFAGSYLYKTVIAKPETPVSASTSAEDLALEAESVIRYKNKIFGGVKETPDLTYRTINGQALQLDMYEPKGDKEINRPFIIVIHSGAFTAGTRKDVDVKEISNEFAKRGYVVASIDYRLMQPDGPFDINKIPQKAINDAVNDTITAFKWMEANKATYRIDPTKGVLMGTSAGGITALYTAYTGRIKPVVTVSMAGTVVRATEYPSSKDIPYTILIHGTEDKVVPYQLTADFNKYLNEQKIPHKFLPVPGVAHLLITIFREKLTSLSNTLYEQLF